MGLLVATAGRILLPPNLEHQALTVLEVQLAGRSGRFDPDQPADDLSELARCVGVSTTREGEWMVLATDRDGAPEWSDQAEAFYAGLARFVTAGEVQVRSADGGHWVYRYSPDGVVVDGTPPAPGALVEPIAADSTPPPPSPVEGPPPAPSAVPEQPEGAPGPPPAGSPAQPFFSDPPAPRSPGRTVAMVVLLVGGVVLIVAVAMLAAGIA